MIGNCPNCKKRVELGALGLCFDCFIIRTRKKQFEELDKELYKILRNSKEKS